MKKSMRFFAGLLALCAVIALFGAEALAATTLTFTVGTNENKTAYRNNGNIVEASLKSGTLPAGLAWNWDSNRIWVYGKPTKEGKVDITFATEVMVNGRATAGTEKITIVVQAAKLKITKSPTGEKVREGGTAKFVAKAENAVDASWHFVSPKNKDYRFSKIKDVFPKLGVKGGQSGTLELSNIPAEMDGWSVYCRFYSDKTNFQKTKAAKITVTRSPSSATQAPAAQATPVPEQEPTAEPVTVYATPEPTAVPLPDLPAAPTAPQGGTGTGNVSGQGSENPGKADHTVLFVVAGAAILVVILLCGTLIAIARMRESEARRRDRYDDED